MKGQPLTDDDNWLTAGLHGTLGAESVPTPDPTGARYHVALVQRGRRSAWSSGKLMSAVMAATIVLALGAVSAFATTGSADPAAWSAAVSSAVSSCKGALDAGDHSIGACVSAAAKSRGQEERAKHANGSPNSNSGGNGQGHGGRAPGQGGGAASPLSSHGISASPHGGSHSAKP
jgi:hypothetical protein